MTAPVPDFAMKAHDTLPSLRVTLTLSDGSPIDLTTSTSIDFIMREETALVPVVDSPAIVFGSPTDGVLEYEWIDGDTDIPGIYRGEFEIHWSTGKKQTVPTLSYITISILADLDDE